MSGQLTLVRTFSNVSIASTLVEKDDSDTKSSKLSPAPSVSSLRKLATQHLANNVPTVGAEIQKLAKSAAPTAAQKAAGMLAVPKEAVVKESKVVTPFEAAGDLEAGQSTLVAGHVDSRAVRTGTYVGAFSGAGVSVGSTIPIIVHMLAESSSGAAYASAVIGTILTAFCGVVIGGKVGKFISAKIQAGNKD